MKCPGCEADKDQLEETSKFDGQQVFVDEVRMPFECQACGCLFEIIYHPIGTSMYQLPDPQRC